MQQTKITKTLGEFQNFLDSDNKTGICLEDTLKFFDIQCIFGHFECIKQRGIRTARATGANQRQTLVRHRA